MSEPAFSEAAHTAGVPASDFRILFISGVAAIIGVLGGIIAYLLDHLIGFFTNVFFYQRISFIFTGIQSNPIGLWVILVPVIGGLIVGVMAKYGSPRIKGHGIDEAMEAVLVRRSRIEPKVAILKPVSAAIAIGTGGPFGAEGPIIQTGSAVGSVIGQILHTTAAERKVLLACGAAAGLTATFSTPVAGVILAIELLLFEFKTRSFIPLVIASAIATATRFAIVGPDPVIKVGAMSFDLESGFLAYVTLGIVCGFVAVGMTKLLSLSEDLFEGLKHKFKIDDLWIPAIGAVGLGVIGFFMPRVLGSGYDTIADILNDKLPLAILISIMVFKALAFVISLGSGTSGGTLAPMFMVSAAVGAVFACVMNMLFPSMHLSPGAFALVAMGAVFGAAARATFTFIIFAFEVTRDYNSVLPLMLVAVIADTVAVLFMKNSIMTEKLVRRGVRIHQDYEPDILQHVEVNEVMDKNPTTIQAGMKVRELADSIAKSDPFMVKHEALPILDDKQQLVGIITRGDIVFAMQQNDTEKTVAEIGAKDLVVTYPDEALSEAVEKMLRHEIGRLPVVEHGNPKKLIGYLGRAAVLSARLKRMEEENVREKGWLPEGSRLRKRRRAKN